MSQLGCDVDEMTALEELLLRHGQDLTSSATRIDGALSGLTWSGSDAVAFAGQWRGRGRAALIAAANLLESSSAEVKRNRLEQLAASAGTGSGGTGGGTAPGVAPAGAGPTGAAPGAPSASPDGGGSGDGPERALPDPTKPGVLSETPLVVNGHGATAKVDVTEQHNADGTTSTVEKSTVIGADGMEHETTKTTVTDAHGHVISSATEVAPPKHAKPETEVKVDLASGSAEARQDIYAKADGVSGDNYAANYDVELGARESAAGEVTIGKDGLQAEGTVGVFAGGQVSGAVDGKYGVVSGGASAIAKAGASAEAKGSVGIGPDGVHAGAGASAELAATIDGEAHVGVAGVTTTVKGGVGAGLGAHADIDASFGLDKIGAKVDVGAYIGLGGNLSFDVSVDPSEVATSLVDVGETIGDYGGGVIDGIDSAGRDVIGGIGGLFGL